MATFVSASQLDSAYLQRADVVIVGAGFFGLTIANKAASEGKSSLIIEKRSVIGGNATSHIDRETSIEVHPYGSHLFHTSNAGVWDYVRQFTDFNSYQHTVWARLQNSLVSLPINLQTIRFASGLDLTPTQAREWLESQASKANISAPSNFREVVVSQVGELLYELIYAGYSEKQWQTPPEALPKEVASRLPIRTNLSNRYFSDRWEGLPTEGYFEWQNRMVDSELVSIALGVDYFDIQELVRSSTKLLVYTGPLDRFYQFEFGGLGWRTLDFAFETLAIDDYQGAAVVNYPSTEVPWTRIHEFKHLHPERSRQMRGTVISREFSRRAEVSDEPYYPINSPDDRSKLGAYRDKASNEDRVVFGGRLGTYQYLDMHMAIGSAIAKYDSEVRPRFD